MQFKKKQLKVARRLEWKSEKFVVDTAATTEGMLWETLKETDPEFNFSHTDKNLTQKIVFALENILKTLLPQKALFLISKMW